MLAINTEQEFRKKLSTNKLLIIGAGKNAKIIYEKYGKDFIEGPLFFDNDIEKKEKGIEIGGCIYNIYAVEDIVKYAGGEYVAIISVNKYLDLYDQVCKLVGELEIFVYKAFVDSRNDIYARNVNDVYRDINIWNGIDESPKEYDVDKEGFIIPYLPIYLTTRCTLNCKNCNNLMPLFKGKHVDFDINIIKNSIDLILKNTSKIVCCELVGGEPFLYPDLTSILDYIASKEQISQIVIVTNGTIIPSDEIIKKLREYNVLVRISDYGLFEKIISLINKLEFENVNVRILADMHWWNAGGIEKRNRSKGELHYQYNACNFSMRCKYLMEDKLFTCARIASLYKLGIIDAKEDMLTIDNSISMSDLRQFYLNDNGEGCDYCDLCTIYGNEIIESAEQVGRELKKSKYTVISVEELERLRGY